LAIKTEIFYYKAMQITSAFENFPPIYFRFNFSPPFPFES
jgi:hypothetical protein